MLGDSSDGSVIVWSLYRLGEGFEQLRPPISGQGSPLRIKGNPTRLLQAARNRRNESRVTNPNRHFTSGFAQARLNRRLGQGRGIRRHEQLGRLGCRMLVAVYPKAGPGSSPIIESPSEELRCPSQHRELHALLGQRLPGFDGQPGRVRNAGQDNLIDASGPHGIVTRLPLGLNGIRKPPFFPLGADTSRQSEQLSPPAFFIRQRGSNGIKPGVN